MKNNRRTKSAVLGLLLSVPPATIASTSVNVTVWGYNQQTILPNQFSYRVGVSIYSTDVDFMSWHSPDNSQQGQFEKQSASHSYHNYSAPQYTFTDVQSLMSGSGLWPLSVTKNGVTSIYGFTIDFTGLNGSRFGSITTTSPRTNGIYPSAPQVQWTTPTSQLGGGAISFQNLSAPFGYQAEINPANLAFTPPVLPPGQYYMNLQFPNAGDGFVPVTLSLISGPAVLANTSSAYYRYSVEDWTSFTIGVPEPSALCGLPLLLLARRRQRPLGNTAAVARRRR
jgi:hypothetical protein